MIGRLIRFLVSLLALALLVFGGTALMVIFSGLTDLGLHADVALVPGHGDVIDGAPDAVLKARLDRATQLYQQEAVSSIIVSGANSAKGEDEAAAMDQYLEAQKIPSTAIVQDSHSATQNEMAHHVAEIMRIRDFSSVMLVTQYYLMMRTKQALMNGGVLVLENAHVGAFQKEDAPLIAQEVVTLYRIWYNLYLRHWVELAMKDAKVGCKVAMHDMATAKETISHWLDNLAK